MSLLRSARGPIDPSDFLRHLQNGLIRSGKPHFNIFQQQDAAEILTFMLAELSATNPFVENLITVCYRVQVTCNKCNQDNLKEDRATILQVPVKPNIQSCLQTFLAPDSLQGENSFYCHVCKSHESAVVSQYLTSVGQYLILQTKRFIQEGLLFNKHLQKIACTPVLTVPVLAEDDRIEPKDFKLLATVNHTGSLERGHYTSFVQMAGDDPWFHCNDAAVVRSKEEKVNNDTSYIYFYERI